MLEHINVLIISHPRSGSYWFQECLYKHYNMDELFNVRNIAKVFTAPKRLLVSNYSENETQDKTVRESIFNSIKIPKAVKTHFFQIDDWTKNWILKQNNIAVIFLERKNKEAAFKSLLISNHLKKFKGTLPSLSIQVKLDTVKECHNAIFYKDDFINKVKEKFAHLHFFYEDALQMEKTDWFDASQVEIKKQDSTSRIQIENYGEVQNLLKVEELDVSERRIF